MILFLLGLSCKPLPDKSNTVERPDTDESMLQTFEVEATSDGQGFLEVEIPLIDGDSAIMITGFSESYLSLEDIVASNGETLFSWVDWYDSDYSITEAIFAFNKDVVVQWPIRDNDPDLTGDSLLVVLSTLNNNWGYQGNRNVDLVVQVKTDDDFSLGTVKVVIAYAGNLSENESLTSAVEAGVDVWKAIWSNVGLNLEARFTTIELSATVPSPENSSDLFQASEAIASEDELLMIIGDTIQGEPEVLGISGGIPGSLVNSKRSAVVVSWLESAGFDAQFNTAEIQMLGETMAHEIGHYMGLYHPVEADYNYWDALEDTEECRTWNACETQLGNNLMFPYPICYGPCELQTEITNDQMSVLQRYTGTL